jgi:hypothetical protein
VKTALLPFALMVASSVPASGQAVLETESGEARLDQLPAGAYTALGGRFTEDYGTVRVNIGGSTREHFGVGRTGQFSGDVRIALLSTLGRIEVGPMARAARGIGERWSKLGGVELRLVREFGLVSVEGSWQEGMARIGDQRAGWGRRAVGATMHAGPVKFHAGWEATAVRDSVVRSGVFFDPRDPRSDTLYRARVRDVADASIGATWTVGNFSIGATAGTRRGTGVAAQQWWQGSASLRLTANVNVTADFGRTPSEVLLGLRGGQYTTFGMRLDVPHRRVFRKHPVIVAAPPIEISREISGQVRVRFALPTSVRAATLTGDVTTWQPVALTRLADGRWEVWLDAVPGLYRVNLRLDDGPWLAPPGMPAVDDDFGGRVGLLAL